MDVSDLKPVTERVSVADHALGTTALDAFITAAYETHSASIYGLALRSTRDPDLAADITQETFLRLLTEGQRGRLPDNVGGWLYRTSANLVVSGARRASVARRFIPRLLSRDVPEGPETMALDLERHRELDAALATLSVADRLALVLSAQGATGEEIAVHLGRSHAATRTHLTRARARLRVAVLSGEATR